MRFRVVAPLVLLVALVAAAVGFVAGDGLAASPEPRASVGECVQWGVWSEGFRTIRVPSFCKNRFCQVFASWEGDSFGAFSPGIMWPVTYIQRGAAWQAGPAVSIAGVTLTAGSGVNGDGADEFVFGGGATADGSFFWLNDDWPGVENARNQWVVYLENADPGNPAIDDLQIYACPLG